MRLLLPFKLVFSCFLFWYIRKIDIRGIIRCNSLNLGATFCVLFILSGDVQRIDVFVIGLDILLSMYVKQYTDNL